MAGGGLEMDAWRKNAGAPHRIRILHTIRKTFTALVSAGQAAWPHNETMWR